MVGTPGCEGGFRLRYARSGGWLTIKTDNVAALHPDTPVTALVVSRQISDGGAAWHGFASKASYMQAGACSQPA